MGVLYKIVEKTLVHWGYLAVVAGLLGENAGLPLPGETVLMFASFTAHKHKGLEIWWVIMLGIAAAIMGDNIGFWVGRKLGDRLIRWLKKIVHFDEEDVGAAKSQIRRHGKATIFWARFIFGLRAVAGPLAGVLGMEWRDFVLYNALGAVTWVTAMSLIGYEFANKFNSLLAYMEKAAWAMAAGLFTLAYLLWRHKKKKYKERLHHHQPS
jgi:membrane protein DedA with SNARE-associated domain